MEKYKLSELIFDACDRIHEATTDLYERLHPEGNPRFKHEDIELSIKKFREWINFEIDAIRSATSEYRDEHKD